MGVSQIILLNWNNYTDGNYTMNNAHADFGSLSPWADGRALINKGSLCTKMLKNALSDAGGIISNIDVVPAENYSIDYYVKFHSQFDWSGGGKVGFGFKMGDGNTGGNPAWSGNGGSLRLIWYQVKPGHVVFKPYLYYKDQPGTSGDDFGVSYPNSGSLEKGKWYVVHMEVKSNTGAEANGHVLVAINGTVLLDRNIRWTTNDTKRLINRISFDSFRGGNSRAYTSPFNGYVYYDNLKIQRISTSSIVK
jgi:hypothetical protein